VDEGITTNMNFHNVNDFVVVVVVVVRKSGIEMPTVSGSKQADFSLLLFQNLKI